MTLQTYREMKLFHKKGQKVTFSIKKNYVDCAHL